MLTLTLTITITMYWYCVYISLFLWCVLYRFADTNLSIIYHRKKLIQICFVGWVASIMWTQSWCRVTMVCLHSVSCLIHQERYLMNGLFPFISSCRISHLTHENCISHVQIIEMFGDLSAAIYHQLLKSSVVNYTNWWKFFLPKLNVWNFPVVAQSIIFITWF